MLLRRDGAKPGADGREAEEGEHADARGEVIEAVDDLVALGAQDQGCHEGEAGKEGGAVGRCC